jgi:hypothetical protein
MAQEVSLMRWHIPNTALLALFVAVSCDQQPPTGVAERSDGAIVLDRQASVRGGGAPQAVTGSGHYINNVGNLRTFSFQVRRNADGSVRGVFQLIGHARPPARWHGRLTCFSVAGNEAWIGGFYEKSTNPALVDTGFGFYVKDNGEGGSAVPDLVTPARPGPGESRRLLLSHAGPGHGVLVFDPRGQRPDSRPVGAPVAM